MLKEKITTTKDFIKEHKNEICLSIVSIGVIGVIGYKNRETINKLTSKLTKVTKVAKDSLERELSRIDFDIEELQNSIDRLDPTININKFHRIPERQARIEELLIQRTRVIDNFNSI